MRLSRYKKIHDLVYYSRQRGYPMLPDEIATTEPKDRELKAIQRLEVELKALRKLKADIAAGKYSWRNP